jgi:hypothetical protein
MEKGPSGPFFFFGLILRLHHRRIVHLYRRRDRYLIAEQHQHFRDAGPPAVKAP